MNPQQAAMVSDLKIALGKIKDAQSFCASVSQACLSKGAPKIAEDVSMLSTELEMKAMGLEQQISRLEEFGNVDG